MTFWSNVKVKYIHNLDVWLVKATPLTFLYGELSYLTQRLPQVYT